MGNWVIVAIPEENDPVWKISSEKIPHLTMLFLGEHVRNAEKEHRIVEFLKHVADTSLSRFGLSVDRRGELGDDKADVVFFEKTYGIKDLEAVRSYLLTDQDVYEMYHSTEQYPEWLPHLTLGYPETPAKADDRDYPGINWVNFDRLALWTGDFQGEEIRLKSDSARVDEVSMSNSDSFMKSFLSHLGMDTSSKDEEFMDDFLEHYGIRGMRWGIRRRTSSDGTVVRSDPGKPSGKSMSDETAEAQKSADFERAAKAYAKSEEKGLQALSNEEIKAITNRVQTEKAFRALSEPQKNELQQKVERLRLEKEYKQLQNELNQKKVGVGRKIVNAFLEGAVSTAKSAAQKQGQELIQEMLGRKKAAPAAKTAAKAAAKGSFRVNPNKVKFTRTPTGGIRIP